MRYIAILGRQPLIGMAELERVFGAASWFAHDAAVVDTPAFDIQRLGGTVKAGRVIAELGSSDWRKTSIELVRAYEQAWDGHTGKITLGMSAYGFKVSPRDIQRTGLILKSHLKQKGVSLRLVPNEQAILSTATAHHNKLGLSPNKVELLVVKGHGGKVIIAESTGTQNITALARRDQGRPARDAFVGMLPPKLAQILVNLAVGDTPPSPKFEVLDPFCGTGVVLQEALLLGFSAAGSDINPKMVDYTGRNLDWLRQKYPNLFGLSSGVQLGDATTHQWVSSQASFDNNQEIVDAKLIPKTINAVACETYLGQPFSAPPSAEKLAQVRGNCDHIISEFLKNIGGQIKPGTPLCLAVPAWKDAQDNFTHLPLIKKLAQLGYQPVEFKNVNAKDLLYYRPDQVVARELLVLEKL